MLECVRAYRGVCACAVPDVADHGGHLLPARAHTRLDDITLAVEEGQGAVLAVDAGGFVEYDTPHVTEPPATSHAARYLVVERDVGGQRPRFPARDGRELDASRLR